MTDESEIGYRKPPKHTRFNPGVSGNPKGRKKSSPVTLAKIIAEELNAPVAYRERGRTKFTTRQELTIQQLIEQGIQGNLATAEQVLKLRAHAKQFGDAGAQKLLITDWLPDYRGQIAEQKTRDFSRAPSADPHAWWDQPDSRPDRAKLR
jgi:hypothetical protein